MRLIDADALEKEIKEKDIMGGLNYSWYIQNAPTVDVLDKIRNEIVECLEAINTIKAMPIQLYTPNEIEARKLTYEQCLGFIDKYTDKEH